MSWKLTCLLNNCWQCDLNALSSLFLGLKNPNILNILGANDVRICLLLLLATLAFPIYILAEIFKTPLIKIL